MENCEKEKIPKRVIHFSDGVVPEYSSDEDETTEATETRTLEIDPVSWKDNRVLNLLPFSKECSV